MQYKCVPAPTELVINSKSSYEEAVGFYADLMNMEADGGWIFHSIERIVITQNPGCLAALFGQKPITDEYNMLVFSNDKIEKHISSSNKKDLSNEEIGVVPESTNTINSENVDKPIIIDESINMGQYKSKLKFYVRESPSLSSKELFTVEKDEVLTVIACGDKVPDSSLGYVKNKKGMKGWCYFNNLTKI